jgi:hypothetical protein
VVCPVDPVTYAEAGHILGVTPSRANRRVLAGQLTPQRGLASTAHSAEREQLMTVPNAPEARLHQGAGVFRSTDRGEYPRRHRAGAVIRAKEENPGSWAKLYGVGSTGISGSRKEISTATPMTAACGAGQTAAST